MQQQAQHRALSYLALRPSYHILISLAEKAIVNTRKMKRQQRWQAEDHLGSYSIYNLINIRSRQSPPPYQRTHIDEILKSIEDYNRTDKLFGDNRHERLRQDLINTRKVNLKVMKKCQSQLPLKKDPDQGLENISNRQLQAYSVTLFYSLLTSGQVTDLLCLNESKITSIRAKLKGRHRSLLNCIERTVLSLSSTVGVFLEHKKIIEKHKEVSKSTIVCQSEQRLSSIAEAGISSHFLSLTKSVLHFIHFHELIASHLSPETWPDTFVVKEQGQLLAQKINSRTLYRCEEKVRQLKETLITKHMKLEVMHRKRHLGNIHSRPRLSSYQPVQEPHQTYQVKRLGSQINRRANADSKSKQPHALSSQSVSHPAKNRQKPHSSQAFFNQELSKREYSRPQRAKIDTRAVIQHVSQPIRRPNSNIIISQSSNQPNSRLIQPSRNPTQLISQQNDHKRVRERSIVPSAAPVQSRVPVRYPLKIRRLILEHEDKGYLCYSLDQISIKSLTLDFLTDRWLMGENQVRVVFGGELTEEQQLKLRKALQILNCLGGMVGCKQEDYSSKLAQADETLILSVSWMTKMPVKEVVKLYSKYQRCCDTKK